MSDPTTLEDWLKSDQPGFGIDEIEALHDLLAELDRMRAVVEAARQALAADAVADWQDAEGDGLRSVLRAYDEGGANA